jgi:hypothetical protein
MLGAERNEKHDCCADGQSKAVSEFWMMIANYIPSELENVEGFSGQSN